VYVRVPQDTYHRKDSRCKKQTNQYQHNLERPFSIHGALLSTTDFRNDIHTYARSPSTPVEFEQEVAELRESSR
jgi:hypothetical protein